MGFIPWDGKTEHGPLDELIDRLPAGRALDLGCGTGYHAVTLAQSGWDVTGVDIVQPALDAARSRAADARVEIELIKHDIVTIDEALTDRTFDLIVDIGCLHGLSLLKRRQAYRGLARVTHRGSTFLLLSVLPRRGIGPHGFDETMLSDEIGAGWTVESTSPQAALNPRSPLGSSPFQWYVLKRA